MFEARLLQGGLLKKVSRGAAAIAAERVRARDRVKRRIERCAESALAHREGKPIERFGQSPPPRARK